MTEAQAKKLAEPLDRARVKTRPAGGSKPALAYLETHDIIRTANSIFGFGGWGHEIVELRPITGVTVHGQGDKAGTHVGYVCIVRLTVDGCQATSGVGYGDATEYRESAAVTAHELAAKEAESDALKRALKNFGDQFGLALYDKQAASSGHVTSASAPKTGQAGPAAAEQKTQEDPAPLVTRLLELNAEYKQLVPDFDAAVTVDKIAGHRETTDFVPWLRKQIVAFEGNVQVKREAVEAAAKFPIPKSPAEQKAA